MSWTRSAAGLSADGRSLLVKVDGSLAKLAGDVPSQLSVTYKLEKESTPRNRLRFFQCRCRE